MFSNTRLYFGLLVVIALTALIVVLRPQNVPKSGIGENDKLKSQVTLAIETPKPYNALDEEALTAAFAWFEAQGVDFEAVSKMPIRERAAKLNQAVYAFCKHGEKDGHINELFDECLAACGGYSYVLRGLLEATGARTRYVNLYNMPNQGNHTGVEVEITGEWSFYDPTFGAYFTADGEADGPPLSAYTVSQTYKTSGLDNLVQQSRKERADITNSTLSDLYKYRFSHDYMALQNYSLAESFWFDDPEQLTILDIGLDISDNLNTLGNFNAQTMQEMQTAFMEDIRRLLLDDDLRNDISFVASGLYHRGRPSLTTLTIDGLEPGATYKLSMMLFNPKAEETNLQVMSLDRTATYIGAPIVRLGAEKTIISSSFIAEESTARLAVRNIGPVVLTHLFGVHVETSH